MKQDATVRLYTTPKHAATYDLRDLGVEVVALPLKQMVWAFLEESTDRDICVLPHFPRCHSLLVTLRAKHCASPIVFVAEEPVETSEMYALHRRGAMLVDAGEGHTGSLRFILLFLAELLAGCGVTPTAELSEDVGVVQAMQVSYPGGRPDAGGAPAPHPGDDELEDVLQDAVDEPERISADELVHCVDLRGEKFSVSFSVWSEVEERALPLCCIATLARVVEMGAPRPHHKLMLRDFRPAFGFELLYERAKRTTPSMLERILTTDGAGAPSNAVKLAFEAGRVSRTCTALPVLEAGGRISFVLLSDAILQKRRYFRITPAAALPLTAVVSTMVEGSTQVPVLDVSERGLAFWSEKPVPLESDVTAFLSWPGGQLVCRGLVRFCGGGRDAARHKIGVELYPRESECTLLRDYVFRCQMEIVKLLRQEREGGETGAPARRAS